MHALALVVLPAEGDLDDMLNAALGQWSEEYRDAAGEWQYRPEGWWDWWQIGGRYTGTFSDYDPRLDPANIETCPICQGTGMRDDQLGRNHRATNPDYTCNGCDGKGARVSWPTEWGKHDGDVTSPAGALATVPEDGRICFTIVCGETILHRENYDPDGATLEDKFVPTPNFDQRVLDILRNAPANARVVAVDYHS